MVAVAAAVLLVLYIILQCGITTTSAASDRHVHVPSVSASSAPTTAEGAPGHTHIEMGSPDPSHESPAVIAMPRGDGKLLRLPMLAVVAVAIIGSVVLSVVTPASPRSPPPGKFPVRSGRTVLDELCISRC